MKRAIIGCACMVCCYLAGAQAQFYATVKIEFEKTVATQALYKELFPEWYDNWKDHIPQRTISYFDFIADSTKSIYKPGRDVQGDARMWDEHIADKNTVYTDFVKYRSISQKPVYEETFLVDDSLLNIKWKITNDTRTIAGYQCRKAVGILFDTVAVFAFYSDELMVPGGPEGIHGLPGMILGAGIPRLHTTWFATKVQVANVQVSQIQPEK
ncbi:MAG TPA: GLPGLI family protein, partial [Chitinophagaceae bacterium]